MIFCHNLINWEGMVKDNPFYHESKRSFNNYINFKESKVQNKTYYQVDRGTSHNNKGIILQEDMTILNLYSSNKGAFKNEAKTQRSKMVE